MAKRAAAWLVEAGRRSYGWTGLQRMDFETLPGANRPD
jgi:hypothetical protein